MMTEANKYVEVEIAFMFRGRKMATRRDFNVSTVSEALRYVRRGSGSFFHDWHFRRRDPVAATWSAKVFERGPQRRLTAEASGTI